MASFSVSYSFKAIDQFSETTRKIGNNLSTLARKAELANQKFMKLGQGMVKMGRRMSLRVTAPLALISGLSIRTAADFEKSMNMVQAVSGATGKQFEALTNQAMELGATTQYTASQAAQGQKFLAMAGMKTNKVLGAMPSVLQLAASAQLDLASAADITTNILTGYQMKTKDLKRANDILVTTFTNANVDLVQLGQSMKMLGPIASGAGMKFSEAAAAVGLLGNAGLQGQQAGTGLRRAIAAMLSPTKQMTQIMKQGNLVFTDAHHKLLPLTTILKELQKSGITTGGIMQLFGLRGGQMIAALVGQGAPALEKLEKILKSSGGIAERIAKVQMRGLTGAWLKLKSAAQANEILFTKQVEPSLLNLTNSLTKMFLRLSKTSPLFKEFSGAAIAVTASIAPLLFTLGKIVLVMGFLGTKIPIVAKANYLLSSSFRFLWKSVFLPIAVITTLITLFDEAYKHITKFRNAVNETANVILKFFKHFDVASPFINFLKMAVGHVENMHTAMTNAASVPAKATAGGALTSGISMGAGTPLLRPSVLQTAIQQTVKSSLDINVQDPHGAVKSVSGTGDHEMNLSVGTSMAFSRV
jgi:TP901 family phage tail tape measure protein